MTSLDPKVEDNEETINEFNCLNKSLTPSLSRRSIWDMKSIKWSFTDMVRVRSLSQSRCVLLIDLTKRFVTWMKSLWDDMVHKLDLAINKKEVNDLLEKMTSKNNNSYKIIFVVFTPHLFNELSEIVDFIRNFEVKNNINPTKICALGMLSCLNIIVWESDKKMIAWGRELFSEREICSQNSLDGKSLMMNISEGVNSNNSQEDPIYGTEGSVSLRLKQSIEVRLKHFN
jgi:hypothetical protein